MNTTIGKLCDHLVAVFESSVAPTQDEWFIILMLNSLGGKEYDWLQKNLLTQFTNSKITPTSKDIVDAINFASYDHHREPSKELANAAKAAGGAHQKLKSKKGCTNCGNGHHNIEDCWSEGGGAYGKAPDWWKRQKSDEKKKSKANALTHSDLDDSTIESTHLLQDHQGYYLSCFALDLEDYDKCSVQ